jgi:hypothetical protein
MEIFLINEALFKENSPLKSDTLAADFAPYLGLAQRMYIERVLGVPLTKELKEQVSRDELSEENEALILMIAPALSFYAVYQGLPFHWAAIVNKGVTLRESENSKSVDLKDIAQLRLWIKNDAEEFLKDLIKYLQRCHYPLWQPSKGCGSDKGLGSAKITPDTGIFIPKGR